MALRTKILPATAVALTLVGITAATANAATTAPDTATPSGQVQVTQPQYSHGFNVTNKGTHNLKLVSMDGEFDSTPAVGHILPPNGNDHFEATFWALHVNYTHANYDILDAQGAKIGTYTADMSVGAFGIAEEGCSISMGSCTPNPPENTTNYPTLPPLYVYEG
jgi:hypothetical protein